MKRDLAATCADGVRKKAKYLQDAYDSQQQQSDQGSQPPQGNMLGGLSDHLSDQDQMQRHNSMEGTDEYPFGEKEAALRQYPNMWKCALHRDANAGIRSYF